MTAQEDERIYKQHTLQLFMVQPLCDFCVVASGFLLHCTLVLLACKFELSSPEQIGFA
jgi:hypothetical protein